MLRNKAAARSAPPHNELRRDALAGSHQVDGILTPLVYLNRNVLKFKPKIHSIYNPNREGTECVHEMLQSGA